MIAGTNIQKSATRTVASVVGPDGTLENEFYLSSRFTSSSTYLCYVLLWCEVNMIFLRHFILNFLFFLFFSDASFVSNWSIEYVYVSVFILVI